MLDKSNKHLESVHESYWQHFSFALYFGVRLIGAGFAVVIHALCPALFQTTGSGTVTALYEEMQRRKAHQHDHHHE